MRAFKDDRGRAYNDIFPAIGVGDINVGILYPGTIKAFHRHKHQDDYWFVVSGNLRVVTATQASRVIVNPSLYSLDKEGERVVFSEHPAYSSEYQDRKKYCIRFSGRKRPDGWEETFASVEHVAELPPEVKVSYLSEGETLHIPAGVWHGLQVLGDAPAIMIYHITNKYNALNPDEERANWDAFYTWERSRK